MQIRMKMTFCAVAVCAATLAECPRWISVMPLKGECAEELAKDSADLGETTLVDGIAWCCTLHPEGDPVADRAAIYAEAYRKVAPRLKSLSSVKQGILLQATMGHGGRPGSPTPWQLNWESTLLALPSTISALPISLLRPTDQPL